MPPLPLLCPYKHTRIRILSSCMPNAADCTRAHPSASVQLTAPTAEDADPTHTSVPSTQIPPPPWIAPRSLLPSTRSKKRKHLTALFPTPFVLAADSTEIRANLWWRREACSTWEKITYVRIVTCTHLAAYNLYNGHPHFDELPVISCSRFR
jgi:hypothetical protein